MTGHPSPWAGLRLARAGLLVASLVACADPADPTPAGADADSVRVARPLYTREYVFVGERADAPLVVPFAFRASDTGSALERTARGWLAHAATWDPFLTEAWSTPRASGVWRIVPRGPLSLVADGPLDLSALWFEHGDRRLRLDLRAPLSGWTQGDDARYRFRDARLQLGPESVPGTVVEGLRIRRPPTGRARDDDDWLFLVSGDSLRLLVAEASGGERSARRTLAGAIRGEAESWWDDAQVRWVEMRPLEEARRDVPLRWSFSVPAAGIHGEVVALGYNIQLGEERGGQRAVELRYTVEGWVEIDGARSPVIGTIRHNQG